jgi:hypothetical protein
VKKNEIIENNFQTVIKGGGSVKTDPEGMNMI